MMVAQPREDPQSGMFDVEIDDPDFEAAIAEHIGFKETRAAMAKVKRAMVEGAEKHDIKALEDGTRVRVGAYTFEVKARAGGGFEMPEWETRGMANARRIGIAAVE